MNISVVVPAYNRNDVLIKCVNALLVQKVCDLLFEIIVVDDCSKELCSDVLKDLIFKNRNLRVVRHSKNKGLAAARNTGARSAQNQIVIFLDSDIVPNTNYIQSNADLFRAHFDEEIAVVSNLSYPNEMVQKSNFARYMNNRYLGNRTWLLKRLVNYEDLPGKNFGGGICALRLTTFFEVGGFDETFVKYGGEDEDMGCRLRAANIPIKFCPDAKAIHHDYVALERSRDKTIEWVLNAFPILNKKHPQYFSGTAVKYFKQPSDSVLDLNCVIHYGSKRVFNPLIIITLEKCLGLLDGIKFFYFPPLYRILFLAWFVNGQKLQFKKKYSPVWQ
jgi:GT2 family glycosyltransferase